MIRTSQPTFVFLGPSLGLDAAQAVYPGAIYLPPVQMGDVYRLVRHHRPARIAIVDGYFERVAAVWHKEILFALERGVEVFGAASMGALRAAELHPFGMVGVGRVFADYRRGLLVDDDEVAIAHGPAEYGYPHFSEAMVDLRDGLGRARRAGVVGARTHDRLVLLAKSIFYRDRGWENLVAAGRAANLPRSQLDALAGFVVRTRVGLKAADTRTLLRRLAGPAAPRHAGARPPAPLARTWFWHRMVELVERESDAE
jgi:hypothetical protein